MTNPNLHNIASFYYCIFFLFRFLCFHSHKSAYFSNILSAITISHSHYCACPHMSITAFSVRIQHIHIHIADYGLNCDQFIYYSVLISCSFISVYSTKTSPTIVSHVTIYVRLEYFIIFVFVSIFTRKFPIQNRARNCK